MAGSERLWDIFQTLAGASEKALSLAARMKREAADAKLRSHEIDLIYASGNFLQSLQGRNDFENFESDWQRERDRLFTAAARGADNNYTLRGLEQMYAYHDARQRLAVQEMTAGSAGNYANAQDSNSNRRIMDLPLPGQQRYDMSQQVLERQYESNRIDHTEYYTRSLTNMLEGIRSDGLRLIDREIEATTDTEADPLGRILRAVDGMDLDAYRLMVIDPNTGQEIDRSGDIPREAEREKLQEQARIRWNGRVKQEQAENDNRLSVLYGQLKELPEGEWNAAADRAIALINRDMAGYRLSPEDRRKWIDSFGRVQRDLADSADRARKTMWQNILDTNMAAFIQAGIRGESGDQRGMRNMYDAFDRWLETSLEKLRQAGYAGSAEDMRLEFAGTVGKFFTEAAKALPEQLKGALNDAKEFVESQYVNGTKSVSSPMSRKYPGMRDSIAGAVVEQLRDWLFGNDLSLMTLDAASEQINAIVNAQVARELDVLRKDPETGKLNYGRQDRESEEALLARTVKVLENRELVWTDDTTGTLRYALGTEEGIAEAQSRLREWLAGKLEAEGIAPGEIGMEFTESVADRDKDAAPVFTARGKQYRFVSDGTELALETRSAGDAWAPYTPPASAPAGGRSIDHPDNGSAEQEQEAARREIQGLVSSNRAHAAITPRGMDAVSWRHILDRGAAFQILERLRTSDPEAYRDYKRRVEEGAQR